jgi:hypothetical protein
MDQHHARLILRFVRYHEMVGEKQKTLFTTEEDDASCGFMSTIRGIWVQAEEPFVEEEEETETEMVVEEVVGEVGGEEQKKEDGPQQVRESGTPAVVNTGREEQHNARKPRNPELQIFAPPIMLRRPPHQPTTTDNNNNNNDDDNDNNNNNNDDDNNNDDNDDNADECLATVPTRGARSMTAYHRTGKSGTIGSRKGSVRSSTNNGA